MAAGHIGPGNLGPAPASAKRAVRFLAGPVVWHRLIRCGRLLGVYQYPRARQRVRSVSGCDDGCICGLYCPGVQPAVFDLWPLVQPSTAGLGGGFPFTLAIGGMAALLAAHGLPLVVPGLRPPGFLAGGLGADIDRKSTRLNSSHVATSYAVFCLKRKRPRWSAPRRGRSSAWSSRAGPRPRTRAIR